MTDCSAEISTSVAAKIAGCSPDTIVRLIEEGAIEARRLTGRGWWKIERKSLIRYLDRQAGKGAFENAQTPAVGPRAVRRF